MHISLLILGCIYTYFVSQVHSQSREVLTGCDVVIVGGGLGGLYSAYELTNHGVGVCLFEKEERWGGRYLDIFHESIKEEPIGTGAWRIHTNHDRAMYASNHIGYHCLFHIGRFSLA